MQDDGLAGLLELFHGATFNAPVLNEQDARLDPFPARPELDFSDDRIECRVADVLGELLVVERTDRRDSRFEDLHLGIGIRRDVEAKRINARTRGALAVSREELLYTG